jgi:pSer/pThr/pTyr-binding forkhead associated (FHA) protein
VVKAYLKVAEGNSLGAEFPIEERQVIGRAAAGWNLVLRAEGRETSLRVYDALVSRQHASLYFEGGQLMIRDVGSLNGTAVNGRLLPQWVKRIGSAPLRLKDGFIVKIGNTEMEISIGAISADIGGRRRFWMTT